MWQWDLIDQPAYIASRPNGPFVTAVCLDVSAVPTVPMVVFVAVPPSSPAPCRPCR